MINNIIFFCYLQEIIKNTGFSRWVTNFYLIHILNNNLKLNLLNTEFKGLVIFCEKFEKEYLKKIESNLIEDSDKKIFEIHKIHHEHRYKSQFENIEKKKKDLSNSIFYSFTSISLLLFVFLHYKHT